MDKKHIKTTIIFLTTIIIFDEINKFGFCEKYDCGLYEIETKDSLLENINMFPNEISNKYFDLSVNASITSRKLDQW